MIDIEALLEPISAESPCGEDLSFSSEFDAIQEARRSDDASLEQGEWVTDLKTSDWFSVSRQCGTLLRTRSKDLRLAVWLAEASARMDGFTGLAGGYRLVAGLCDRYWDTIHPEAEGDDHELRVGNLSWLLTQSIQWARSIPLTNAPHGRYDAIALEVAARGPAGDNGQSDYPDASKIDAARAATPFEFYQQLAEQAPLVLDALKELESVVDVRLGDQGPSFSAARDAVGDVVRSALRMASAAGATSLDVAAPPPLPGSAPAEPTPAAPAPAAAGISGEIASRREALLLLRRVADFFRRTEPHSPVAYLADKAARWGNMPLHVWLKTVVKDSGTLSQLEDLLDAGTDESRNG
jgi:type VI secretion system protein ImpA